MNTKLQIILKICMALCLCTAMLCPAAAKAPNPGYGIHIQTAPHDASEYTSILLDNGEPLTTDGKTIRIDMDLWAYPDNPLGSICKVIADNNSNIDLMYCIGADYIRFPMLVTGDRDIVQSEPLDYGKWVHVRLTMSPETGEVELDYNGVVSKTTYDAFVGAGSIRIAMGFCTLTEYPLFDVASVAIRDVEIHRGDKAIRHWKMERHDGDVCYDEIKHSPATVENASWLIDENASWKKIYSAEFSYYPSVAFDPRVSTFYMASKDSPTLYVFHVNEETTDTIRVKGGEYAAVYPNQLMYIPQHQQLLSYNLDENIFSFYDPVKQSWSSGRKTAKEHAYWNNTTVFDPADSAIVSFGGYGFFHYNNTLLRSYPYSDRPQSAKKLTAIHPRYSCSSALVDGTLYIFGGRGCQSGRQELGPRNYYDMYAVDLKTDSVTMLWDLKDSPMGKGNDFIPGENMVYDRESDAMYILTTYHGGSLFKVDMKTGRFEQMSLDINASLQAQTLYYNLYYSPTQKSFYAVIVNSDIQGVSTLNIYQLDYPPVAVASLSQNIAGSEDSGNNKPLIITLICLGIAACGLGGWWFIRRRKRVPVKPQQAVKPAEAVVRSDGPEDKPEDKPEEPESDLQAAPEPEPAPAFYNLEKSSVRLLGGFRVFDAKGEDITNQFTPTLKNLLILLILHTGKNPMGIPNSKILTLLWGDKEEEAAKNNRNVYMSRLRNILVQIGDVTVQSHNGFRNISFGEGTTCDYLEAMRLFEDNSNENIDRLLELLLNGMVLPNVENDIVDTFKSAFSDRTLDLFSALLKQPGLSANQKLKIADTLFQHDFINEDALIAKCRIRHAQGRTGLAQATYAAFCKEYKSIIGSDYPNSLSDILNNNIKES